MIVGIALDIWIFFTKYRPSGQCYQATTMATIQNKLNRLGEKHFVQCILLYNCCIESYTSAICK